jgi:hypothetical protein
MKLRSVSSEAAYDTTGCYIPKHRTRTFLDATVFRKIPGKVISVSEV